jgi:hypothetical protein
MEEKYIQAIKAGLIFGAILVLLSLIYTGVERFVFAGIIRDWMVSYDPYSLPDTPPEIPTAIIISSIFTIASILAGCLMFAGAGILSVIFAKNFIKNRNDALVLGAASGAIAEVVHRPFAMLINLVANLLYPISGGSVESAFNGLVSEIICCLPIVLISGMILSALSAVFYAIIKLRV